MLKRKDYLSASFRSKRQDFARKSGEISFVWMDKGYLDFIETMSQ